MLQNLQQQDLVQWGCGIILYRGDVTKEEEMEEDIKQNFSVGLMSSSLLSSLSQFFVRWALWPVNMDGLQGISNLIYEARLFFCCPGLIIFDLLFLVLLTVVQTQWGLVIKGLTTTFLFSTYKCARLFFSFLCSSDVVFVIVHYLWFCIASIYNVWWGIVFFFFLKSLIWENSCILMIVWDISAWAWHAPWRGINIKV